MVAKPKALDIFFATFPYGGNGGISSEVPDVRNWLLNVQSHIRDDQRIGRTVVREFSDTPITMTRNQAVLAAREWGAHVLVMIDSDMSPDVELGDDPTAKPFFPTAFDHLYEFHSRGGVVVGAPYCGPPPDESVYVFIWRGGDVGPEGELVGLDMFTREEAACRSGIQPVAALPTGLIMFDMQLFDLTEPTQDGDLSWFDYEWTNHYHAQKGSTEDVVNTRDMSIVGSATLGYNPVRVAWDCWAGHWKPKCVRKPRMVTVEALAPKLIRACQTRLKHGQSVINVSTKTMHDPILQARIASASEGGAIPLDLALMEGSIRAD